MIDDPTKPTEMDLIKLELRDLLSSVGELRMGLNSLRRKVELLERRCACDDTEMRKTLHGSVYGLEGEWTVTPPPGWEA